MHLDDPTRLRHMADACREARGFVAGKARPDLDHDRMLTLALVKCVEIVGEAANGVTGEFRAAHPEVPWRGAIAMRNRLVHGYFDVDLDRVWDTVTKELPPLLAQVEGLMEGGT